MDTVTIAASKPLIDQRNQLFRMAFSFLFLFTLCLVPNSAWAAPQCTDALCITLCSVVLWFTGEMGQAIATLGILVLGLGALFGKVSWPMALITSFGISVMFMGGEIVEMLTTKDASGLCRGIGTPTIDPVAIIDALCGLAKMANSNVGKALGTIAIGTLGVTALMGKISAGLAIMTATGIAILFGADSIGQFLFSEVLTGGWTVTPKCAPAA